MDGIVMLPVESLHPHPDNPRRDVGDVTDLARSIRAQGIRQNLLVVPQGDGYRVVIGHRRLAAARLAGLTELPCMVASLTEREQRELMIVENSQRSDLKPIEEADAYQGLLDLGMTRAQIAERTGRSPAYVRTRLRVAAIPTDIRQESKRFTQLSLTELEALAEFTDSPDLQRRLAEAAGSTSWEWELSEARRKRDERAWVSEARKAIESTGLALLPDSVEVPRERWMNPKGYERTHGYTPLDGPFLKAWQAHHAKRDLLYVREDSVDAYQPVRKHEPTKEELEKRRLDMERRARERKVQEFDRQARRLRESWIHDSRPFGTVLTRAVQELACEDLLGYTDHCLGLTTGADTEDRLILAYQRLATPLPDPKKDTDKGIWHLATQDNLHELHDRARRDPRRESLLLLIARRESSITWTDWTQDLDNVTDYYRHLETLGYPVSDAERTALAGGFKEES